MFKKIIYFLNLGLLFALIPTLTAYATVLYVVPDYSGNGSTTGGVVTSSPAGINCGDGNTSCSQDFGSDSSVTLTATPDSGRVGVWDNTGGGCTTLTTTTCVFNMTSYNQYAPGYAYLQWDFLKYNVTLKFEGSGKGSVTSSSGGLSCSSSCTSGSFTYNQEVTLTAHPASGSVFTGWDYKNGADLCLASIGKATANEINTSSNCLIIPSNYNSQMFGTAVPIFNLASSQSSSSFSTPSSSSTTSSGSSASSTPTPPKNSITLPSTLGLTLWNGTNFGAKGQTLTPSSSSSTLVGIADKNNTPLATVNVNLSSAQNWSKAAITYASSVSTHKAFVHGLTSAPGVVGGTFTLYVPYAANNNYVGVCPGASSLSILGPNCPHLYYVFSGQKLTSGNSSTIPKGDTVTATVVTINGVKYWDVSGLTGTGGFSSPTNTLASTPKVAASTKPAKTKSSNTTLYIGSVVAVLALLAIGGTYKLWLPKLRGNKKEPAAVPPTTTNESVTSTPTAPETNNLPTEPEANAQTEGNKEPKDDNLDKNQK